MSRKRTFEIEWGGGGITADELAYMIQECHPHKDDFTVKEVADPDRLRLLEAVAGATQAHARDWRCKDGEGMTFAAYLSKYRDYMSDSWLPVLEALAALEAHDEAV